MFGTSIFSHPVAAPQSSFPFHHCVFKVLNEAPDRRLVKSRRGEFPLGLGLSSTIVVLVWVCACVVTAAAVQGDHKSRFCDIRTPPSLRRVWIWEEAKVLLSVCLCA